MFVRHKGLTQIRSEKEAEMFELFLGCCCPPRERGATTKAKRGCRGSASSHQRCSSERHQKEAAQQTGGEAPLPLPIGVLDSTCRGSFLYCT